MRFKHLCAGTQVPFDQNQPQLWSTLWAPAPLTPPAPWRSPAPSLNVNQAKSLPGLKHPGGSYRLTATLPKHFFRFINRKLASSRGTQRLASPCSCGSLAFPRQGLSRGPGRHRTAFEKAWTAGQAAGPYQGARASPPSWPAGPGVFGRSPALPLPSSLGPGPLPQRPSCLPINACPPFKTQLRCYRLCKTSLHHLLSPGRPRVPSFVIQ